jgi:hypothetical protein
VSRFSVSEFRYGKDASTQPKTREIASKHRKRGRTAGRPTAPSQIPACGIPAPGSSRLLASAGATASRQCRVRSAVPLRDPGTLDAEEVKRSLEARPRVTRTATTPVEPSKQNPPRLVKEPILARRIADHPIAVPVSLILDTKGPEQSARLLVAGALNPGSEVCDRCPEFLRGRSPLDKDATATARLPPKLKAQELEPTAARKIKGVGIRTGSG